MTQPEGPRRYPIGAEPTANGGADFRVWAPDRRRVEVVFDGSEKTREPIPLSAEGNGYFSGRIESVPLGALYRYRLDGAESFPDPASRFQPDGVHGPSMLVDPAQYDWRDQGWRGRKLQAQVVYEMHIGTFTREGTWASAAAHLGSLADVGVTVLEIMPIAEFAGRFGWGYDGVDLFAPFHGYGAPDDFRAFVDIAHGLGLAVILDVVYNHFGPAGNYLEQFAKDYFTDRYPNEWGEAVNFDGPNSTPVREFVCCNAAYWVDEFHIDGIRLDATQQMFDASDEHIVAALTRTIRAAAGGRDMIVIAENEPQDVTIVRPCDGGGFGADGLWNDDFHHSAIVALTGHREAYYTDYRGSPQEMISAIKRGFLYQGQHYRWQGKRRGTPTTRVPRFALVDYLENHDQVANSARGLRMHQRTSPGRYRSITALLLLGPGTPLLFQGQEYAASTPFLYFADHEPELARSVRDGRIEFLSQFPSIATEQGKGLIANPGDFTTFVRCKLDHSEREAHREAIALHRDLLRLRRSDPVISRQGADGIDGAILGETAFVIRFFSEEGGSDRLLVVNFGHTQRLEIAPEPLLAPPLGSVWETAWSSESPAYGGNGTPDLETDDGWVLPGEAAVLLIPRGTNPDESS